MSQEPGASNAAGIVRLIARIIGACFLLACFVTFAIGVACYNHTRNFTKIAAATQGKVIAVNERSSGSHSETYYYPVITFTDKAGLEHTLYANNGSYPPAYEVGEEVAVLYDPADPKHAEINSFTSLWIGPLIAGILGAGDLLVGLFLAVVVPLIISWAERRSAKPDSS